MSIYATAAEVRAWYCALEPGGLGERGKIPAPIVSVYNSAHPERPYRQAKPSPIKGQGERWAGHAQASLPAADSQPDTATAAEVRAWGRTNTRGAVADRGDMPRALILAYNRAHPERPYPQRWSDLPVEGSLHAQHRLGGLRRRNPHATLEDSA